MIIKPLTKDEARQRWPWLTEEALADEEYWAYLQRWAYNPPPTSRQPQDITAWLTRQLTALQAEVKLMKAAQANQPVMVEQSTNYLPLPVNPTTGEVNPYALPLESIWLLEAVLDQQLREPKNRITKALTQGREVMMEPGRFEASTTEVRRKVGRRFSDQEQLVAFDKLVDWKIVSQYIWDEKKGSNGGWTPVKSEHGIHVINEWFKDEEKRAGRPSKEGGGRRYIFRGEIHPVAWFIIRRNMAFHRFHEIPKAVYRMSQGAQLLYRQGLPFVMSRTGWRLTFPVACRILGYPESPVKFQPESIEKYLGEIVRTVSWRRDREAERAGGGRGHDRLWVLKASKKEISHMLKRQFRREKVQAVQARQQS